MIRMFFVLLFLFFILEFFHLKHLSQRLNVLSWKSAEPTYYLASNETESITLTSKATSIDRREKNSIKLILVSSWRSGSTFLGNLFARHPDFFYHYEPLLFKGMRLFRDGPDMELGVDLIDRLLKCQYHGPDMDGYLNHAKFKWHDQLRANVNYWAICSKQHDTCYSNHTLNNWCSRFPHQVTKVLRLRLTAVERLLQEKKTKMIYLARDPRATMNSRGHYAFRRHCKHKDCNDPWWVCSDLEDNFENSQRLSLLYPNSFRFIRYEDLTQNVTEATRDLFQFIGVDFHENVLQYLESHTKGQAKTQSIFERNRDISKAPYHWKDDMQFETVKSIQDKCRGAMEKWQYRNCQDTKNLTDCDPVIGS